MGLVECGIDMAGMFCKFDFGETFKFVVVNCTVADELYLRNAGDGFEVGTKDRVLRKANLNLVASVSIALRLRIKCLLVGRISYQHYHHNHEDCNQTFVRAYC